MKDNNKTTKEFEKALFTLLKNKNYHDITVNEISSPDKSTVDTQLVFTKSEETEMYDITGVTLNNYTLTEKQMSNYWYEFVYNY